MELEQIYERIEAEFPSHIEKIRAFLRQPSISYTGEGIRATAELVREMIHELGGDARLVETALHPIVLGEIQVGAPYTVLIYSMYDTMPADEPGWTVPPWAAEIRDWEGLGPCIIARGAVNTKGPLAALFCALQSIKAATGTLPVNLIFAIEGEEEYGSRNFRAFAEAHREELNRAQACWFPTFRCDESGDNPGVYLGHKGITYFELTCTGGDWGGPTERAIHGSANAWVKNPAWRLVKALATLVDADERIVVEGLLDDVRGVTDEDAALIRELAAGASDQTFQRLNAVQRMKWDLAGEELYAQYYCQPQLNIDGIASGYAGPGTKTLVPHTATVKMDVRTVPDMDPDQVVRQIREHLDRHGYSDIALKLINNYRWSRVSLSEPVVQALIESMRSLGRTPAVTPTSPGSAPMYVFDALLGMPYISGGLGHGTRQHSDNEYITVAGTLEFEKNVAAFFHHYVRLMEEQNR